MAGSYLEFGLLYRILVLGKLWASEAKMSCMVHDTVEPIQVGHFGTCYFCLVREVSTIIMEVEMYLDTCS